MVIKVKKSQDLPLQAGEATGIVQSSPITGEPGKLMM